MRGLEPLRLEPADQETHGPLDSGGDERAAAGWSLPDRLGCGLLSTLLRTGPVGEFNGYRFTRLDQMLGVALDRRTNEILPAG